MCKNVQYVQYVQYVHFCIFEFLHFLKFCKLGICMLFVKLSSFCLLLSLFSVVFCVFDLSERRGPWIVDRGSWIVDRGSCTVAHGSCGLDFWGDPLINSNKIQKDKNGYR